ncbi:MAG: hypothetical protein LBV38_01870 [Alistipes sp.]|jgi:hypothetical protein|nr:hypothetical protein [Alistipes sp.]
MRRAVILAALLLGAIATSTIASAQESYTYSVTRTHTVPINWRPDTKEVQRYTLSVSPLRLVSNGLKFDFEYELPKPGHWIGTSISVYAAPARNDYRYWSGYSEGNDRFGFESGFDDYHQMWGIGTSAIFKNTFSRRGWYFATGVTFDLFRVGVMGDTYIPYVENGLTFYDYGRVLESKTYFKPTARFYMGKHMALSNRLYFDMYAGLGLSYAFYKKDGKFGESNFNYYSGWGSYRRFSEVGGFARRGLGVTAGFRFGVLLWDRE